MKLEHSAFLLRQRTRIRGLIRCLALLLCLLAAVPVPAAIEAPGAANLSLEELEEFRAKGVPDTRWPALLETLGNPENSASVRALVKETRPFPAAKLVEMLSAKRLAVRLGALDLLEDAAGDTLGFNPWQEDPVTGPNVDALARWKAWAEKGNTNAGKVIPLTSETFRGIAQEIISGSRDSAERAMQRLDAYGLSAISHIESFLASRADLEPAARAALKGAEYRVALMQSLPKQAPSLARDLASGTAEAQSTALSKLSGAGATALPVIADFLSAPDPLVRETAVDSAFTAGGKHAIPLILARLGASDDPGLVKGIIDAFKNPHQPKPANTPVETAESVLHAMLRGLGKTGSTAGHAQAIAKYLTHPDENVVISALDALSTCTSGTLSAELSARLDDTRWRVRAATLEAIAKRKLATLKDKVAAMLQDSDMFVRSTAVAAIADLAGTSAVDLLAAEFAKSDELKPAIVRTLFSKNKYPTPEMWQQLQKAPPEIILQCLDVLDNKRDDHQGKRIPYAAPFARHPNKDVSAAALRLLASRGRHSSLLLEALNSTDQFKQDAVLDQLHLPPDAIIASEGSGTATLPAPQATQNPQLDSLYKAFESFTPPAAPVKKPKSTPTDDDSLDFGEDKAPPPPVTEDFAPPAQMRATLARFFKEGSPRQKFVSSVSLAIGGDKDAIQFLLSSIETLSPLDRRYITGALAALPEWPPATRELALRLLRDEADDVREGAVEAWMNHTDHIGELLDEFARKGSLLKPDDIYGYELDRLAVSAPAGLQQWAGKTLTSPDSTDAHKVMAIILSARMGKNAAEVGAFLESKNPWLRRAAYRAGGLATLSSRLDKVLADESAQVRAVIPFLASPQNGGWHHIFDDTSTVADNQDFERNSGRTPFGAWSQKGDSSASSDMAPIVAAVEKLSRDPSDTVRFEAMFALMRMSRPVDPSGVAALLPLQPQSSGATYRMSRFIEHSYARLGKAYGVLVPLSISSSDSDLPKILAHFGMKDDGAFTSFASLIALAPSPNYATDTAITPAPEPGPKREEPFRILFFHKPGCKECDRVRDMLADISRDFPKMLIEERNIGDRDSALLNEALSARFSLNDTLRQVSPAVFTQTGALVKSDITPARLGDFLRTAAAATPEPGWATIATVETAAAEKTVERRFSAFSFGAVALAGLLDGINPCAFATIIFLLSYLQVARRTPREILAVGAAFIVAVFAAYFAVGLGIAEALTRISALRMAGLVLNYILAAFAIVIAVLSFRDAQLASRGELGEMTLQLPGMLKDQIRGVIRTGAKATRFVVAAFAAGIVISLLELACTGQVYLPTIQYMLKAGEGSAVRHLLVYNSAFIIPLIIVFALAFLGLRSDSLVRFQKKHTATVKVLTGVLFVGLAAFLLFGRELVAWLGGA